MDNRIIYRDVFTEVRSPVLVASKKLTRFSLTRLQWLSSALLASPSRFVFTTNSVSEAEVTVAVQLLKEQSRYDQIPLNLFDQLPRVLVLVNKVAEEIVCEETDILEEIIPRMLEVVQRVAKYSCDYVRRGRIGGHLLSRFRIC